MMKGVYAVPENLLNLVNYGRAFTEGKFLTGFLNTGVLVVVSVPLAILFVLVLHMGLRGAWFALVIDLVIRGLFTLIRFYSG